MIPLGVLASANVPASGGVSGSFLQTASSGANLATYTFSAQAIGAADATRHIIVAATARKAAPSALLSSMTIGGVSATVATSLEYNGNTLVIAYAKVPTGTTADVVVEWSDVELRCGIGMWSIVGASAITVADFDTASAASGDVSGTVTAPAGSFTIATGCATGSNRFFDWTNATERYNENVGGEAFAHSGSDTDAAGTLTVTGAVSTSGDRSLAVASFT